MRWLAAGYAPGAITLFALIAAMVELAQRRSKSSAGVSRSSLR